MRAGTAETTERPTRPDRPAAHATKLAAIEISVVIPAFRAWNTLPRVLEALAPQVDSPEREVLVVDSSGDGRAVTMGARWPWARFIIEPQRTPQGRARNIGAAASRGRLIALLDADCVPAPDWLDELERYAEHRTPMVAGAILNASPRHPVAVAAHLLDFNEWLPGRKTPPGHAASCNLLVTREAFLGAGGFAEDVWTAEDTLLSFGFGGNRRLAWAPQARVRHVHRTSVLQLALDQYKHGVGFATICTRLDFPHAHLVRQRRFTRVFVYHLLGIGRRLITHPAELARACLVAPFLVVGLAAWQRGLTRASQHPFPSLPPSDLRARPTSVGARSSESPI
jgi:glycosyltransferase involved in cell wall biosynthesis